MDVSKFYILEFIETGHLAVLPMVPVVHESVMLFGQTKVVIQWSRNKSEEEKLKEFDECQTLYNSIRDILNKNL